MVSFYIVKMGKHKVPFMLWRLFIIRLAGSLNQHRQPAWMVTFQLRRMGRAGAKPITHASLS